MVVWLVVSQVVIQSFALPNLKILGFAANIAPEEVVRLTNQKRAQAGLTSLELNPALTQAALAKGTDMINRDYWAHVAPDGTQPWKFFFDSGYKYKYAGENLARDFSNPSSAVEAWMASPSHRDNLLSAKYKEIGIAVVEGDLAGVDTTIIVQLFGTRYSDTFTTQPVAVASPIPQATPLPSPTVAPIALVSPSPTQAPTQAPVALVRTQPESQVLVSPFTTTKGVSALVVGILLFVLILDAFVTSRRRTARIAGRTFAHLSFLGMILAIILIAKAGQIL